MEQAKDIEEIQKRFVKAEKEYMKAKERVYEATEDIRIAQAKLTDAINAQAKAEYELGIAEGIFNSAKSELSKIMEW